jgi:hypothetical protein
LQEHSFRFNPNGHGLSFSAAWCVTRNTVNGDSRWCCTYLLDPTDPLFVEIGKAFVEQQTEGNDHQKMSTSGATVHGVLSVKRNRT